MRHVHIFRAVLANVRREKVLDADPLFKDETHILLHTHERL